MAAKTITSEDFTSIAINLKNCPPRRNAANVKKFLNDLTYEYLNIPMATIKVLRNFKMLPVMPMETILDTITTNASDDDKKRLIDMTEHPRQMFDMVMQHFNAKKNFMVPDCSISCLEMIVGSVRLMLYNLYRLFEKHDFPDVDMLASKAKTIEDGVYGAWNALIFNILKSELGVKAANSYLIKCAQKHLLKHIVLASKTWGVRETVVGDDVLTPVKFRSGFA